MKWLADLIIRRFACRPPDRTIGGGADPYLKRWYVIPRNRWFNIYLHKFCRDDDDRALHDHPWMNCSIVLRKGYIEVIPGGRRERRPGSVVFRRATSRHRVLLHRDYIQLLKVIPCWSLFITGPRVREWGFHCPRGWIHWADFAAADDPDVVGPGCDGEVTVPAFTDDPGAMDRQFVLDSRKDSK